jgi:BT_3987-like, N-terminal domain
MKQFKISTLFFSMLLLAGFTSCLKSNDDKMGLNISKTGNIIEFANTGDNVAVAASTYPRFSTDLGVVALGDTVFLQVNVSYSGSMDAPEDITVGLAVDTAALALFNTQNGSDYVAPPAALFKFSPSVVIKKGTRKTQIQVAIINNGNFDFNVNYALPLQISSASKGVVSGNFGKAMYSFSARNNYDGAYTMAATAPMVDVLNAGLTGFYPLKMHLITFTGNSVALYDIDGNAAKTYGHPIKNGTSPSYYGSFSPVFFFDSNGKITSVTNYYGQESGGNMRSAVLDPTGVNKITFKEDGKVDYFEVSYIMTQSISSPFLPRTYFHEKFTYLGGR